MSDNTIIHLNIIVSGRVQGVGFRYSARNYAEILGITGLIKNLTNGNVYIEIEGSKDQLGKFIDWCYQGPSYAEVDEVNIREDNLKNYSYFKIER
jgi:acylphosphatase